MNCALRLSELASLSLDQVDNEVIRVIGKGNKERKIFLTPAVKRSINNWLQIRNISLLQGLILKRYLPISSDIPLLPLRAGRFTLASTNFRA
ncbi:tyrosine-type recombinase/integrase [Desulfosporosinus sp.]|uniref:tyrosine-type recombinase/integrase n=1 Tax=Desulfosporosinus sp. TaxID=157907 RepID=UPI00345BB1C3